MSYDPLEWPPGDWHIVDVSNDQLPDVGDVVQTDQGHCRVLCVRSLGEKSGAIHVPASSDPSNDVEIHKRVHEFYTMTPLYLKGVWNPDSPQSPVSIIQGIGVQFTISTRHDDQLLARHHKRDDDGQPTIIGLRTERRRATRTTRHATHAVMVPGDMMTLTVAPSGTSDPNFYTVAYILSASREAICVADGVGDQIVRGHLDYLLYDVPTLTDLISQARANVKRQGASRYKVSVEVVT